MQYKKKVIGVILLFAVVVVGVMLLFPKKKKNKPEFVFSYAENQTTDYPTTMGARMFAELVSERTNGRIEILVQADAALGTEIDVIWQMKMGGVDFARISLQSLAEYMPEMNILQMPYLYEDSEHMWKVLDGKIGDLYLNKTEEDNLIGLSWYDAGARNFYNSVRPITCLEDMKGMTLRVQESELMADLVEALGAKAVSSSFAEVYSKIQRGIVDGAENNWPSYEAMGHYEVAKYYTVDEHIRIPELQICSKVTWDKLTKEDQNIIRQCAVESAYYERELWNQREKTSKRLAMVSGVVINELSEEEKDKFRTAMADVYEKYCKDDMDMINDIIALGKE